jgi:hypothetical protein
MEPINVQLNENDKIDARDLAQGPAGTPPQALLNLGPVAIVASRVILRTIKAAIEKLLAK